jgi:hypothetical protein
MLNFFLILAVTYGFTPMKYEKEIVDTVPEDRLWWDVNGVN